DDFWLNVVTEYNDIKLKSVTRSDINLEQAEDDAKDKAKDNKAKDVTDTNEDQTKLLNFAKMVLSDHVKDVIASKKLTSSPSCLAVSEGAMDIRMERFLRDQKQLPTATLKVLELNMNHGLVQKIGQAIALDTDAGRTKGENLVKLLFEQACIIEGEPLKNPSEFTARVNELLLAA
ncbi:MAG: molecular chaperone HtpG, partial [Pseudomonadota bacterium]